MPDDEPKNTPDDAPDGSPEDAAIGENVDGDHDVVIRVEHVEKAFGDHVVLQDVNLEVRRGETLVILGGSGSGKSTLLKLMTGGLRVSGGNIVVEGRNICGMTPAELDAYRRSIGVLFQSGALFNSMTVAENVALPMREHTDLPDDMIDLIVKMKLEIVGLRDAADRQPAEISGGMKKRAGLARAMALDPKILFYDEPSAGLDPVTVAQVDNLMNHIRDTVGVTNVVVTHEMTSAFRVADRMVLLDQGRFVADGTPDEMKNSDDPVVKQFIHGLTEGPLTDRQEQGGYVEALLGA